MCLVNAATLSTAMCVCVTLSIRGLTVTRKWTRVIIIYVRITLSVCHKQTTQATTVTVLATDSKVRVCSALFVHGRQF